MPNLFGIVGNAVNGLLYPVYARIVGTVGISLDAVAGVSVDPALYDATNKAFQVSIVAGGSGGGPATIANGADVAEGNTGDPAATDSTSSWSVVALLKGLYAKLAAGIGVTFANTSIAVTQGTAASLKAQVTGAGAAGTADTGVVTVQGIGSGVAVPVSFMQQALPANQSVNQAQVAGTATSVNSGNKDAGTQRVVLATDQPAVPVSGTFYQATQPASPVAATTGGATPYHYVAAAAANQDSTVVKNGAGQVYSIAGMCAVATCRYLELYDKATAPTSGDTPVHTLMMPANSTTGAGFTLALPIGLKFTSGISFRLTALMADSDATACTAGDCVINLGWI